MATKLPTCHPERKHKGNGLCSPCYQKSTYDPKKNSEQCKRFREANKSKIRAHWNAWYARNAEREQEKRRQLYAQNKEPFRAAWRRRYGRYKAELTVKARRNHLKRKYGITPAQFDEMFERQSGLCAVCEKAKATHVDHDHEIGKVRGLLCHPCNVAIGLLREDEDIFFSAVSYLRFHRTNPLI